MYINYSQIGYENIIASSSDENRTTPKPLKIQPTVRIGIQQKNKIKMCSLIFNDSIILDDENFFDELSAMICLRGRDITKKVFNNLNQFSDITAFNSVAKPICLENFYWLLNRIETVEEKDLLTMPFNSVLIFLDEKTQWKIIAKTQHLKTNGIMCFKSLLKAYYEEHYPKEVVNCAFLDEKNPSRVYAVEEIENKEIFYFENLFNAGIPLIEKIEVPYKLG